MPGVLTLVLLAFSFQGTISAEQYAHTVAVPERDWRPRRGIGIPPHGRHTTASIEQRIMTEKCTFVNQTWGHLSEKRSVLRSSEDAGRITE
jgi:hypothetical protein